MGKRYRFESCLGYVSFFQISNFSVHAFSVFPPEGRSTRLRDPEKRFRSFTSTLLKRPSPKSFSSRNYSNVSSHSSGHSYKGSDGKQCIKLNRHSNFNKEKVVRRQQKHGLL